jgi:hypothetical protein
MTQDAARPRFSTRTGERLSRRNAARGFEHALPAAAVAALAGATFLWRTLAWQPAATVDAWAYAAWGQALARGERPLFELGSTTPKPLAAVLGTLVSPLSADRAFAVVVALALGALAAALFAAAYREGGAVPAAVSVVALALGARLDAAVAFAYVDAVVAALVLAGIALRGRLRIGAFVLAGLLRPEAWLVAGVAGLTETAGSLRRRAGAALAAGLAAPALWVLADVVLMRDPLGTLRWHSDRLGARDPTDASWADVAPEYWDALTREGGVALALAGMLGLGLHYVLARRRGAADPTPITVAVVWSVLPAFQFGYGANLQARYLLPLVAVLALGCGLLAAALVPSRLRVRSPWPAVAVAAGVLAIVVMSMDLRQGMLREMTRNDAIAATRPAVESVLSCGRLGTTRRTAERGVIPQLAAATRRSLYEFGIYRSDGRFAGVLHFALLRPPADPPLPAWPRHVTQLGPLAVAPGCAYSTATS